MMLISIPVSDVRVGDWLGRDGPEERVTQAEVLSSGDLLVFLDYSPRDGSRFGFTLPVGEPVKVWREEVSID